MESLVKVEMKRLNYLISEINSAYHEAAQKLGLSDSAMQILYTICNHGDSCLLNDICKLSGTSKQTINSALRKLETSGMVYLEQFGGKKKKVCLTEDGKNLVKRTVLHLVEIENNIFDSWSEAEQESYLMLTQKYLACFKERLEKLR